MSTRGLLCVYHNSEFKIAKYMHYDCYPEGQGLTAASFLSSESFDQEGFLKNLETVKLNGSEDDASGSEPQLSVGYGAELLNLVQSRQDVVFTPLELNFASNSLFCEWCYVVDLDKGLFEVYKGFNKTPLSKYDRFYFLQDENGEYVRDGYYPVRLLEAFKISKSLGDEFISKFKK